MTRAVANKKSTKKSENDLIESKRERNKRENSFIQRREKRSPEPSRDEGHRSVKAPNPDSLGNQAMMFVMVLLAVFFAFCLLLTDLRKGTAAISGPIGYYTCKGLYGLFGYSAWLIPVVFGVHAALWKRSVARDIVVPKLFIGVFLLSTLSSLIQTIGLTFGFFSRSVKFWNLEVFWNGAFTRSGGGGGVIGGFIGGMLYAGFKAISMVLIGMLFVASLMFMFEITPTRLWRAIVRLFKMLVSRIKSSSAQRAERRRIAREQAAAEEEAREEALKEARIAALKEDEQRRAKENAERERIEKERAEREKRGKEPKNAEPATVVGAAPISYYDRPSTSADTPKTETKKDVEISSVDMKQVSDYKKVPDPAPTIPPATVTPAGSSRGVGAVASVISSRDVNDSDVKEIFSEQPLKPGEIIPAGEKEYDIDGNELRSTETENNAKVEKIQPTITPNEFDSLEPEVMEVEREGISEDVSSPDTKPYELPPIDLLSIGSSSDGDSPEELEANARRLVEVLKSFKVDVEIVHISHGPTITRYEVAPKAGVRVNSISGRVDDIALHMKTSGVRIEPIPGKVAIGIEVPNRCRDTVFLRSLIDTEQFRTAKSKVTCALGVNVAGEPVLLDIAKMPHLLIAGATGMGKSVCINSLLISLLYRAKPDEVKLILIDPKKVELNTYNKLPHLLVPVLNEPKKAAGALAWAVIEMERRFSLIEQYGVRNLAGYNSIVAKNEGMEFLPHIIIVIDELADLMMQAHDDVEDSICRLAAKARAAGMHMIVGTQRPSVDVITGLIKANIPSRIAFTVASNADSRTIIDVAGAEKLIGRGDMLYAPVQEMKPLRLQGSFVSDSEVEKVVSFINDQCEVVYDSDIIDEINEQAALCGEKKKKGSMSSSDDGNDTDDGAPLDPKFYDAVDIAVDAGKISTSLLQRKLEVGYGRAAKIIDEMERRGIVSGPDGQKPRTVLMSRQEYYDMRIRHEQYGEMSVPSESYDE